MPSEPRSARSTPNSGVGAWLNELPYSAREKLDSYLDAVRASSGDVLREAGLENSKFNGDPLMIAAAIRWIWKSIDGQEWVISRSVDSMEGASGFRVGSSLYAPGSDDFVEMRGLKMDFWSFLTKHGLEDITTAPGLTGAVKVVLGIEGK